MPPGIRDKKAEPHSRKLLVGDAEPSGRLPISWERRAQDGPSYENYYPNDASNPNHVVYREGIFVGYRGLQRNHVRPLFPFGFGLSYSTFSYTNLKVSPLQIRRGQSASADRLFELSLDVTNSGRRRAADVVQLYVAPKQARVPRPERELKGIARLELSPGQTQRVSFSLDARAFSYFDVEGNGWRADPGTYALEVARSVDDVCDQVEVQLTHPIYSRVASERTH